MKTKKLSGDIFNKFKDYLKGTSEEYYEILEIQVKYNVKDEKAELEKAGQIINLLLEMQHAGMEVKPDWKNKSLKELQKMFKDYQEEIKDVDA